MKTVFVTLTILFTLTASAAGESCDMPLAGDKIIVKGGTPIYESRDLKFYVPKPYVFLDIDREVTVIGAKRVENSIFLGILIEHVEDSLINVEYVLYENCKW